MAAHIPHCLFELFHWLQTVRNSNKLKPHTFIWRSGSINRGAAASANQTHSEQRDLQHRDPDMTPTIISKEHLPLNNKVHSHPTYSSITAAAFMALLIIGLFEGHFPNAFLPSFAAEKAKSGEDAQRSYQQQHRAAQVSSGSRVLQAAA